MNTYLQKLFTENAFFKKGQKPSLKTVSFYLKQLNNPDITPQTRVVISGTALKGTTCYLIEKILLNHNLTTTLITSPHLHDHKERIRVNGKNISQLELDQHLQDIQKVDNKSKHSPSFYEAMVLSGILAADHNNSDVLILEVGLGGKYDAVNAVKGSRISGLTFIGNDHAEIIGPNLEDIAREKAGIFTDESIHSFTCEQTYFKTIQEQTSKKITKLPQENIPQILAKNICQKILNKENIQVPSIQLPARWEKIQNFILDGAHSEPRFKSLVPKLKKLPQKPNALIGMTKNHDPQQIKIILPYLDQVTWVPIKTKESWQPNHLQEIHKTGTTSKDINESMLKTKDNITLITGSFYLCAEARKNLLNL